MTLSTLQINGPDAQSFLQRQGSNDLNKLNPQEGIYTAFLTPQAKIISLCYLIKKSDTEFFAMTQNAQVLKEHLQKFVITEDVEIVITTEDCFVAPLLAMTGDVAISSGINLEPFNNEDSLIKLAEQYPEKKILENYVSFTKGCFPGQEPLAKFKNIGMKKREERSSQYLDEALGIFARAQTDNQSEEFDKAIHLLKQALKENPKNEDAYETLGVILAKQGKIQEAIMVMHQLEMINPNSIMAQTNLSIFYMKLGDKETAEEHKAKGTVLQFDQALKK